MRKWRERQHEIRKQQAKDVEKLNKDLSPVWPLDGDINKPHAVPVSDSDDSSIDSDDSSINLDNSDDSEGASVRIPSPPS